jgi:hypothetical protein
VVKGYRVFRKALSKLSQQVGSADSNDPKQQEYRFSIVSALNLYVRAHWDEEELGQK